MSQFEEEAGSQTDGQADDQGAKEDEEEDADGFDDGQTRQLTRRSSFPVLLRRLEQHDRDGIVENRLAEYDRVKLRVDFIGVEDGEDGDGVGGGECRADGQCVDEVDVQTFERYSREQPLYHGQYEGGNEGAGEGESQDGAQVAEEVALRPSASNAICHVIYQEGICVPHLV